MLNAVVHKDYASGIPIQISVYPDKLMIWNPGPLPPNWTVEKLLEKHASVPFNPDLANVFFRAGMIESWGRGIERIMLACREAGVPDPDVLHESGGLWIVFHYLPKHQVQGAAGDRLGETPVETPGKILAMLETQPEMTLAELAAAIGKSVSAVERAAAKLVKGQKLRFVGPKKGGR